MKEKGHGEGIEAERGERDVAPTVLVSGQGKGGGRLQLTAHSLCILMK